MENKLTPKQLLFINEYLVSLNATDAALKAGYSPKTASKIGSENLGKPEIKFAIQKAQEKTVAKLEITREQLIEDLIEIKNQQKYIQPGVAIKAIEVINKMSGFDAPLQIESKSITINVIKPERDN